MAEADRQTFMVLPLVVQAVLFSRCGRVFRYFDARPWVDQAGEEGLARLKANPGAWRNRFELNEVAEWTVNHGRPDLQEVMDFVKANPVIPHNGEPNSYVCAVFSWHLRDYLTNSVDSEFWRRQYGGGLEAE